MKTTSKRTVLALSICIVFAAASYGRGGNPVSDHKAHRDNFYKTDHVKSAINKADLNSARLAGFSPIMAYMFARLAKATKTGIKAVLAMHEKGLTWKDMCEKYNVNYEEFMEATAKAIKDDGIVFPKGSPDENIRDGAAPGLQKDGGKND